MTIEGSHPLQTSLELHNRANQTRYLQEAMNAPLRVPGLEDLSTMQQTITELQERYEAESRRLASEQASLEGLADQLKSEQKKLEHGEYLFVGSKEAMDSLRASVEQCLTPHDQSRLQTALILRAGNSQFIECWPSVKKTLQAEIKRLEAEILKLTKLTGGESDV
jgi:chromosome segregation ATPase